MKKYYVTPLTKIAIIAAVLTAIVAIVAVTCNKAEAIEPTAERPEPTVTATGDKPEPEIICTYDNVPLDVEMQNYIVEQCNQYGIRPEIIFAMCQRESEFNAMNIGDNGQSFGLMQIQPRWYYSRMLELNCTNLLDEKQNVTVGISILADLIAEGKGIEWALMAYNAGASNANKMAAQSIVSDYASDVINLAEGWCKTYAYAG